jgi:hypothetical protein
MQIRSFCSYILLIAFSLQVVELRAIAIFSANPTISVAEKRRLKKLDYYVSLAAIACSTGEFDSYKKVPGTIADIAITDLVCKGLEKYTGLKNKEWAMPYLPFLALGGKKLIKYLVEAFKRGYTCKDDLQKRYGTKWIAYFVAGILVPYVLRKQITGSLFNQVNQKTGLTQIQYPEMILSSTILTLLVWHIHESVIHWCADTIQSLYDLFVPETKTEKYLRIKRSLAYMAAER